MFIIILSSSRVCRGSSPPRRSTAGCGSTAWTYVCICMYVCMHACMHACMHVCMYVCTYVRMYVCNTYIYIYICICADYTYILVICVYVCMYIYIYIYMCIHRPGLHRALRGGRGLGALRGHRRLAGLHRDVLLLL